MKFRRKSWLACAILLAAGAGRATADDAALRAYPNPVPEDVSFDTVVQSQPFPFMKYPVTIVGAKVHPEEFYLTPSGQVILPTGSDWRGLCVAALVGTRNGDAAGPIEVALPPADGVTAKLVEGYLPAVENQWTAGDLRIGQLAFATCGGRFESRTGKEPLVALLRYALTNQSSAPKQAVLAIQFGKAHAGMSVKAVPPVYPHALSFESPYIRQKEGPCVACLLTKDLKAALKPIALPNPGDVLYLNENEAVVKGAQYAVEIERQGDAVTEGQWKSPNGADFYVEASRTHSVPIAVDVEVMDSAGAAKPVGKLYREVLSADIRPAADYIAPGQHSAALPWVELAKALPQGKSKLVARCYYPAGAGRERVGSWEPIVVFSRPGVTPRFKDAARHSDENRLTVEVPLTAGESKTVDVAVPYFPLAAASGGELLRSLRLDEELARFREYWTRELDRNAQFIVPEKRIRDAYRACLANNLLLTDRDPKSGVLMAHPDALAYEAVWAGDGSVIVQAMDRLGYHEEAESMLDYFLARQSQAKPEGDVQSADGFFSGDVDLRWMGQDGFVLWAMAEHYKLTRNDSWLRRVAPQLVKGCDWIIRERARTKVVENGQKVKHYGLLPKGRPSDLYIWDNWYWTDTYSYMGLRGTADVLAAAGMKADAARLTAEADDYKACILAAVARSIDPKVKPTFVPPTPYRVGPPSFPFFNENWYSISSPIYMVEAGLLDAKSDEAGGIGYWLEKHGLYSGLPALGAGMIDPYYVYNLSLAQLLRGESAKFVWTLYSLTAYGMAQGTYATIEGHNLVTGFNSESWDANRQPHMHSNSRFIDLVRIAILLEEDDTLHLMAGTPRGWLADGQTIAAKRAPSYFGEVNFTARLRIALGEVSVEIETPKWRAPSVVLHVRPPEQYGKIKSVKVNGQDWKEHDGETVRLPRLDKETDVICVF